MRKLYILRENEEDGRLVDALIAAGCTLDDCDFENPRCPRCSHGLLVAFTEDDDDDSFEVVTWPLLTDKECANATEWFLVCSNLACSYEEQVERVSEPMGATIFDTDSSYMEFDEECILNSSVPSEVRRGIRWLKQALEVAPNRKLEFFSEYAQWQYDDIIERNQKWIAKVPPGKRVQFRDEDHQEVTGTFVTATEDGFLFLREPDGNLVSARTEEIHHCQPYRPDRDELPRPLKEVLSDPAVTGKFVAIHAGHERVVIRGQHVHLQYVDRCGLYHVCTWDEQAAMALSLHGLNKKYWEGVFRRSDIESRYEVTTVLKVRGHWVDQYGTVGEERSPAIRTHDPEVAAALGLELQKPWRSYDDDEGFCRAPTLPTWNGEVDESEVEERSEVRLYHWPLPEFPLSDKR